MDLIEKGTAVVLVASIVFASYMAYDTYTTQSRIEAECEIAYAIIAKERKVIEYNYLLGNLVYADTQRNKTDEFEDKINRVCRR